MKILHIVLDEKFIDTAYRLFEAANPGGNSYVILSEPRSLSFISKTPVRFVSNVESKQKWFLDSFLNYEMVVLHFLDDSKLPLISLADKRVTFVWIGGGADYYDLIAGDTDTLLLPKTLSMVYSKELRGRFGKLRKLARICLKDVWKTLRKRALLNRVSFFAPVLYMDYELIKSAVPTFTPKYLAWNYGSLEDDLLKGTENVQSLGDNILVGNSASRTNNHLDIFEKLNGLVTDGRNVICPLSYGDHSRYREIIVKEGYRIFTSSFVPIVDYMNIDEYVECLASCSVAVMGHLRQQAVGNIVIMIYLGAKIFLYPDNPVYKFFKSEGALIYSIDELPSEYTTRLDSMAVQRNREVVQRHWSRQAIANKTNNLLQTVKAYKATGRFVETENA